VNYNNSLGVTITVLCYLWEPTTGAHFFACGSISRPSL